MATARTRIRLRQMAVVLVVVCILTPVFNVITSDPSVGSAVQGLLDGVLVTLMVGSYLLLLRDGAWRPWFRRLTFRQDLILSTAVVVALFLLGRAVGQVITTGEPARFLRSFRDPHLLFALPFFAVLAVVITFVLQMNRVIGANVLGYFMAGVYHRPKPEERIFLFLDLEGSTQLAERMGSARYFELLRRFVDGLTEPVLANRGEIYQYAGDEVVITWRMDTGLRAANCIRCFFGIRAAVAAQAAVYERDFGVVPRFRGGLHGGTVTAGELGDIRQQIVFVGDILNTAARLEEYAKRASLDLVVSDTLLRRLSLPPGVEATRCGELALRGKEAHVTAYAIANAR